MVGMFQFRCFHCQKNLKAFPDKIGKSAKCPGCRNSLTIPTPDANTTGLPSPPALPDKSIEGEDSRLEEVKKKITDIAMTLCQLGCSPLGSNLASLDPGVRLAQSFNELGEIVESIENAEKGERLKIANDWISSLQNTLIREQGSANKRLGRLLVKFLGWFSNLGIIICFVGFIGCFLVAGFMKITGQGNLHVIALGLVLLVLLKALGWLHEFVDAA